MGKHYAEVFGVGFRNGEVVFSEDRYYFTWLVSSFNFYTFLFQRATIYHSACIRICMTGRYTVQENCIPGFIFQTNLFIIMASNATLEQILNTKEKKLALFQNILLVAIADRYLDDQESDFLV